MVNWFKKNLTTVLVVLILILGFFLRIYSVDKDIQGDVLVYKEWGQRLFQNGPKDFYYSDNWFYSSPNYPPIGQLAFSAVMWLNDKRFLLAQLHNLIKIPPADFIIYFYKWGDILMLKLLPILSDLGLGFVIYKIIIKITKNKIKGILGMCFFILNPLTIFLSGVWGQTDSVVALISTLSFLLLLNKNIIFSIPLMFLGLYFKFSWATLIPLYIFVLFKTKPKILHVLVGFLLSAAIFFLATQPFTDGNVISYGWKLFWDKYPIPFGVGGKASVSAFNFHTIFWKLDIDFYKGGWAIFVYAFFNIVAMFNFVKQQNKLLGMISGIFIAGMASFLFMPSMLERYFFPAYPAMVILAFSNIKLLVNLLIANLIFFANIVYAFYRRQSDEIYHIFIDINFLLIKTLSIIQTMVFLNMIRIITITNKNNTNK